MLNNQQKTQNNNDQEHKYHECNRETHQTALNYNNER